MVKSPTWQTKAGKIYYMIVKLLKRQTEQTPSREEFLIGQHVLIIPCLDMPGRIIDTTSNVIGPNVVVRYYFNGLAQQVSCFADELKTLPKGPVNE